MKTRPYHTFAVMLIHEENIWVADVPALTSCVTSGSTKEEAMRNIKEALESVIATFAADHRPLPLDLEAKIEKNAEVRYVTVVAE